jgi:hypothetical protein
LLGVPCLYIKRLSQCQCGKYGNFIGVLNFLIRDQNSMLKHGFDMYNVFLSAPGDLEKERDICRGAISEVNASAAMPSKILLVTLGVTNDAHVAEYRSVVAENIRQSAYFIQVFEDDWGPKNLFRKMFYLAADCRDDPALPMQELAVFLKAAPRETDAEILAFRKELEERPDVRVFHFDKLESLEPQVAAVCSEWVRAIIHAGGGADAARGAAL